ncbi:hypothetical protein [Motilibacter aurantiacus]|nr:hypothetical protein [Motilibacter aurantiacus]
MPTTDRRCFTAAAVATLAALGWSRVGEGVEHGEPYTLMRKAG